MVRINMQLSCYSSNPECSCVPAETRVALIQRSCGYALRPTLSIDAIEETIQAIKACSSECTVIVDNCYGEFTERLEPCHVSLHPSMTQMSFCMMIQKHSPAESNPFRTRVERGLSGKLLSRKSTSDLARMDKVPVRWSQLPGRHTEGKLRAR